MKGMELSRLYWEQFGAPMLAEKFPEQADRVAAGLAGEGSECFGFDDELSRDHDWGPSFCLWLNKEDYADFGPALAAEYGRLPKEFLGCRIVNEDALSAGRRGVLEIGGFFRKFTGLETPPSTLREWRAIPESYLAVATNGAVFRDPLGEFTAFRETLAGFYPEDVRRKKLAARCAIMAQAGQYNYGRCLRRGEPVAAQCALAEFISASTSAVFLLNRAYKPYYKWAHRAMKALPLLGGEIHRLLGALAAEKSGPVEDVFQRRAGLIEDISGQIAGELARQDLSSSSSDFLLEHALEIQGGIRDPALRSMHVMAE